MNRYYLAPDSWSENVLSLSGDEAHHATRVMREKAGHSIELFDGLGTAAVCTIQSMSKTHLTATIQDTRTQRSTRSPITLCQAIPKGGNMELIIQKSVELGVSAIQPLITEHTVARPESFQKKRLKWQRIALEACKQSGQNYLPEVHQPLPMMEWISHSTEQTLKIIAALRPESSTFASILKEQRSPQPVQLLIGPEGDFSPSEYELAFQHSFQPVSLGEIILRAETASIYCLSVLKHELS